MTANDDRYQRWARLIKWASDMLEGLEQEKARAFAGPSMALNWYNFRTGKFEYSMGLPSNLSDMFPQTPAAKRLYEMHLALGKSPVEALKKTLEACAGKGSSRPGEEEGK
jgi:hypothetical protein